MNLLTAPEAVTALWVGLELVGKALLAGAAKEAVRPAAEPIGAWIYQKTGWKDKSREKAFFHAYAQAEQKLMDKHGLPAAYRISRLIPRLVDSGSTRERLILSLLDERGLTDKQNIDRIKLSQTPPLREEDVQLIPEFMSYLRQSLFETKFYRPMIDFNATESAQKVRELLLGELEQLSGTVDSELRAIRVTTVETVDFEKERQIYLKQAQRLFEEQEFVGFPELKEQKKPVLLKDIYVPLHLKYTGGGEDLSKELGQLAAMQYQEEPE